MNLSQMYTVIDTHVAGEPARIVVSGVPFIKAKDMAETKKILAEKYDHIRTSLMLEPRGHRNMFGALILPPINPEADLGLIFMDTSGYVNMCGHATMSAIAVAMQLGIIDNQISNRIVKVDTPVGLVKAEISIVNGKLNQVSVVNVPSFLYKRNIKLGEIKVDVVFGGDFFVLVDVNQLDMPLELSHIDKFVNLGMNLLKEANQNIKVQHPIEKHVTYIDVVEFYDTKKRKNIVVFGNSQFDRSPCGTGTCAKMALMHAKKELAIEEEYIQESIISTFFNGKILQTTKVGEFDAIIPQISGKPIITGINHIFVDDEDELGLGFLT